MTGHTIRTRNIATLAAAALFAIAVAACGSSVDPAAPSPTPQPAGPTEVTEEITATSSDGVLFDVKLTGSLHDHDGDGSFRDEVAFVPPDGIEFQGHFPGPDGDLVIVSCFTSECTGGDRSATFTVRYWTIAE